MVAGFYDGLAETYDALYPDWSAEVTRQATSLGRLLGVRDQAAAVLADVACGMGTQLIGLAQLGYRVIGSDISSGAVARARRECAERGLPAALAVADMRSLPWPSTSVDAIVCADNALPHLLSDDDAVAALSEMARVLRPGGTAVITTRHYDEVLRERPEATPPQVFGSGDTRIVSFQARARSGRPTCSSRPRARDAAQLSARRSAVCLRHPSTSSLGFLQSSTVRGPS